MSYTNNVMHQWFAYLFEKRMNSNGFVNCFECGKPMHESTYKDLSTCYSHILSKKKYPEWAGNSDNVKITCVDCHNLYSMKPKKAVKQYDEYLRLKDVYQSSRNI